MSIDLSGAKIDLLDKDYPQKHNDAMDLIEAEINGFEADVSSQVAAFEEEVGTEVAEFEAAVNASVFALQAQFDELESDIEQVQLIARDPTAWVSAILKARGLTGIKSIVFKKAEGWERTVQASYVTETRPTGRFLGDYATATAAWAANYQDVATIAGDYYWQTSGTIGLFECTTLNSSSQRYRAGSAHMPLEAVFVASGTGSDTRLRVFDLTDPLLPPWMVFIAGVDYLLTNTGSPSGAVLNTMDWADGKLVLGHSSNSSGLYEFDFKRDFAFFRNSSLYRIFQGGLTTRTSTNLLKTISSSSTFLLSNSAVSKIAIYKGYIAAATAGGVSVVKPDGTVVKSSDTNSYSRLAILRGRLYAVRSASSNQIYDYGDISTLGASFTHQNIYSALEFPYLSSTTSSSQITGMVAEEGNLSITNQVGVDQLWPNSASYADSLIARKGTTYATPPMKKPEVMLICSTITGSVAGTDLTTNGGFAADTDWTKGAGWTIGSGVATKTAGTGAGITQAPIDAFIVGATYKITYTVSGYSAGSCVPRTYPSLTTQGTLRAANGTYTDTFTVTAADTSYGIDTTSTFAGSIDNVSLVRVGADHSGKSNHATINGTLTATAHATGGVAMLSGFTTISNYLSAPNPWSGVGTGEAWIAGAFKCAANSVAQMLICCDYYDGAAFVDSLTQVYLQADGTLRLYNSSNAAASSVTASSASTYDDGLVHTLLIRKTATHYYLEVDGSVVASVAVGAHGNLSFNASATLKIGRQGHPSSPAIDCSIALVGAGKVALTADESAEIHKYLRNLVEGKAALDEIPSNVSHNALTDTLHCVGTTYEQTIRDGRVTVVGSHGVGTSPVIACGPRGEVSYGGSTSLTVSVPERNLHEYVATKDVERFTIKYEGDASRVNFPDPTSDSEMLAAKGAKPVRISNAGSIVDEGAAEAWLLKQSSFGWWAQFAVAPSSGNNITVEFEREIYK